MIEYYPKHPPLDLDNYGAQVKQSKSVPALQVAHLTSQSLHVTSKNWLVRQSLEVVTGAEVGVVRLRVGADDGGGALVAGATVVTAPYPLSAVGSA